MPFFILSVLALTALQHFTLVPNYTAFSGDKGERRLFSTYSFSVLPLPLSLSLLLSFANCEKFQSNMVAVNKVNFSLPSFFPSYAGQTRVLLSSSSSSDYGFPGCIRAQDTACNCIAERMIIRRLCKISRFRSTPRQVGERNAGSICRKIEITNYNHREISSKSLAHSEAKSCRFAVTQFTTYARAQRNES